MSPRRPRRHPHEECVCNGSCDCFCPHVRACICKNNGSGIAIRCQPLPMRTTGSLENSADHDRGRADTTGVGRPSRPRAKHERQPQPGRCRAGNPAREGVAMHVSRDAHRPAPVDTAPRSRRSSTTRRPEDAPGGARGDRSAAIARANVSNPIVDATASSVRLLLPRARTGSNDHRLPDTGTRPGRHRPVHRAPLQLQENPLRTRIPHTARSSRRLVEQPRSGIRPIGTLSEKRGAAQTDLPGVGHLHHPIHQLRRKRPGQRPHGHPIRQPPPGDTPSDPSCATTRSSRHTITRPGTRTGVSPLRST